MQWCVMLHICVFIIAQSRGKTTKQLVKGELHPEGPSGLNCTEQNRPHARLLENIHKPRESQLGHHVMA